MKIQIPSGATPIDPNWEHDLIPAITMMGELNEFEQQNILKAYRWARKKKDFSAFLSIDGLRELHRRMFNDVWFWAGKFRRREMSIGFLWEQIEEQVHIHCENTKFRIDNDPADWIELAVTFHHRLVQIHPFVNGNGRHARLAADLLLYHHKQPELPWGGAITTDGDVRGAYLEALRAADKGDDSMLIAFAQSDASSLEPE